MRIAFTGHRDKKCEESELDDLFEDFPEAEWVHGGAHGFDTQVSRYASYNGIIQEVFWPDYDKYGKRAPLVRNEDMLKGVDLLVACWDGRAKSGTAFTIKLANQAGIPVRYVDFRS